MAKKKAAPQYVEPEEENQEIPEEEPETDEDTDDDEPEAGGKRISKAAAVREALAQGKDGPEEGTDYIRRVYGLEVTRQMFSSYKTKAKQGAEPAPKGKPGRKPKAAPSQAVEGYLAPPPVQGVSNGEGDLLAALEAMKPLVAAMGADKVKRLADLLG